MSLRKLPAIQALQAPKGITWDAPSDIVAKFSPEIRAASDDANEISIYGYIGEDPFASGPQNTAKRIAAALRSIGDNDVTVSINSPGGSFFEGIAIYNLLRDHPKKVTVKVVGLAASAGSIIAMAGDEIQIARAGFMMIHNAWVCMCGNRHDMREAADDLEPFDAAMADLYAARSGQKLAKVKEFMDDEKMMGGSEAVSLGFADSLLAADQITEGEEQGQQAALRRLDVLLAKAQVSRSERRALIKEITGKPSAADEATPSAGDHQSDALLRDLLAILKA
jgi:ATP-dependent Clp protease protease subunit